MYLPLVHCGKVWTHLLVKSASTISFRPSSLFLLLGDHLRLFTLWHYRKYFISDMKSFFSLSLFPFILFGLLLGDHLWYRIYKLTFIYSSLCQAIICYLMHKVIALVFFRLMIGLLHDAKTVKRLIELLMPLFKHFWNPNLICFLSCMHFHAPVKMLGAIVLFTLFMKFCQTGSFRIKLCHNFVNQTRNTGSMSSYKLLKLIV